MQFLAKKNVATRVVTLVVCLTVVFVGIAVVILRLRGDPDILWKIVHGRCVPDQTDHSDPAPCTSVDLAGGWAVLKDSNGNTQFLLIPTARVTGVEDPSILSAHAPNYWEAAWSARRFVEQRASGALTNDEITLAINSRWARSQNQLHIHVDCIRPDVHQALLHLNAAVGTEWTRVIVLEQQYEIRRLNTNDLHNQNIFDLVANHLPSGETMDRETIVLVGANTSDKGSGFYMLAGRAGVGGNTGSGEMLQDHACAVAKAI
jgi:CDP-diacylglycerol pyrophosphatase